jgi:apolipoprotein N-acyltransferase
VKLSAFALSVASGVLLWAAFFPLDLGPLGFVALAPWLVLVRAPVSNRVRYLAAYAGGFAFALLATNWLRVAHPMMYLSWLGLSLAMPATWLIALALIRRLDKLGVPLALAAPVGWVSVEYARMHFPAGYVFLKPLGAYQMSGFGWYFLGYTQHDFLPLVQIADLGGVYAVSFVVAAVNGLLADAGLKSAAVRRWLGWEEAPAVGARALAVSGVAVAVLVSASVGYGVHRLRHAPFVDGPLVAAIQGSVSQGDKMAGGPVHVQSYSRVYATAFRNQPRPDLIVWPETCYLVDWCEVTPGAKLDGAPDNFKADVKQSDEEFRRYWGTNVLFGLSGLEWDGQRVWKYNTALLADPNGVYFTRYDKMHLVPFGEYVPFKETLPFMSTFTPYKWDYSCRPGEKWTRFPLTAKDGRSFTFGCLICYEDSDTYLARQYVASEPVDFLVNISNDGWFDGTEEHEQHLAICRFRAVEARRSVVRGVNMGISGVIDPDGRVIALPGPTWRESKKVEGVVVAVVPIDGRASWYAKLGDWLPAACWTVAGLGLAAGFVRRKSAA